MDRATVYPGQVPLETDLLRTNRYAMIALGRLALDILGSTTTVSGLAANPTSPASMAVTIGAGAIYSLQNVDNTAYSSLSANITDQILKQGILNTSDAFALNFTAPTAAGTSIIYLIEAAFSENDTDNITLPFYNATTPSVPYSGPGNSGSQSSTRRAGQISIQSKASAASSSPTPPAADTGYVPLYYVTVAYGQTSITSANIAVATGAPFLTATLGNLIASYAPLASPAFTGTPTAPTPATSDSSTKIATTAYVNNVLAVAGTGTPGAAANLKLVTAGASNYTTVVTANRITLGNATGGTVTLGNVNVTGNINGTVGAAGGLDAGTLAASTWYNVFVIYNPTTASTAVLYSLSPTAPTLPTGYTYFARVGAVRTDASKYLLPVLQYGKRARYVVTPSSSVAAMPIMASGTAGGTSAPTWVAIGVAAFVPPTASDIVLVVGGVGTSGGIMVAPNANYGSLTSSTNQPPLSWSNTANAQDATIMGALMLESTNIYWASSGGGYVISCYGWEDSL